MGKRSRTNDLSTLKRSLDRVTQGKESATKPSATECSEKDKVLFGRSRQPSLKSVARFLSYFWECAS